MDKTKRILITGASGMVGQNLIPLLRESGYRNLLLPSSRECDLCDPHTTHAFFQAKHPEVVIHLAGFAGDIKTAIESPVESLQDNALMGICVIDAARRFGIEKMINLSSSCVYPRLCPQPMREKYLLTAPLEPTNESYALGKILTLKLCQYAHRQYGMNVLTLIPPNLYGPYDRLDLRAARVIAAIFLKIHAAKVRKEKEVTLWGTGNVRREFLCVTDAAKAIIHFLEQVDASAIEGNFLNIGSGSDVTIRELATLIATIVGYEGTIRWDVSQPDGMPQKLMDSAHARNLGWTAQTLLADGLRHAYPFYIAPRSALP